MTDDIRWIQRLNNWTKALNQLTRFMDQEELDELQEQGLIQAFEYNHELAWNTQKDFLEDQGVKDLFGSKTVAKESFKSGLITDGAVWMDMIESRNLTSHTYNEDTTKKIINDIVDRYYDEFYALHKRFVSLAQKQKDE